MKTRQEDAAFAFRVRWAQSTAMRIRCPARHIVWACSVGIALLPLTSCLVVVATSPTAMSGATIVFVATDNRGGLVGLLLYTAARLAGNWRVSGVTAADGSFACGIGSGVARIRLDVVPPAGYVLVPPDSWPRHVDVPRGGSLRIEVRVRAAA